MVRMLTTVSFWMLIVASFAFSASGEPVAGLILVAIAGGIWVFEAVKRLFRRNPSEEPQEEPPLDDEELDKLFEEYWLPEGAAPVHLVEVDDLTDEELDAFFGEGNWTVAEDPALVDPRDVISDAELLATLSEGQEWLTDPDADESRFYGT